jgi:hypothetical protein
VTLSFLISHHLSCLSSFAGAPYIEHVNAKRTTNRVPVTVPQGGGGTCYFGVIDVTEPFKVVELRNIGSGNPDGIVLDNLTVALPEHVIPRPYLRVRVAQVELC